MDEYVIKSDSVPNEHSTIEQPCHVDNQQQENSTQNQPDQTGSVIIINEAKMKPMNPTPLYIFLLAFQLSYYIHK
jgi:hypothetical protein